jgi:hypothetical protein
MSMMNALGAPLSPTSAHAVAAPSGLFHSLTTLVIADCEGLCDTFLETLLAQCTPEKLSHLEIHGFSHSFFHPTAALSSAPNLVSLKISVNGHHPEFVAGMLLRARNLTHLELPDESDAAKVDLPIRAPSLKELIVANAGALSGRSLASLFALDLSAREDEQVRAGIGSIEKTPFLQDRRTSLPCIPCPSITRLSLRYTDTPDELLARIVSACASSLRFVDFSKARDVQDLTLSALANSHVVHLELCGCRSFSPSSLLSTLRRPWDTTMAAPPGVSYALLARLNLRRCTQITRPCAADLRQLLTLRPSKVTLYL